MLRKERVTQINGYQFELFKLAEEQERGDDRSDGEGDNVKTKF